MILHHSLASSSKGNCHLISQDEGKTYIMIDCGLPYNVIRKKMFDLKIDMYQVKAVLVTHEHGDHIKAASELSKKIPVYLTEGTAKKYKKRIYFGNVLIGGSTFSVNDFVIMPFNVKHTALEPVNFLLMNKHREYILYVTDTGTLEFNFKNIRPSYIIIEANYDLAVIESMLESGDERAEMSYYRNIVKDEGHLSIQTTIEILQKQIPLNLCKQISLCHVSETNGSEDFYERVFRELGGKYPVKQLDAYKVNTIEIKEEELY